MTARPTGPRVALLALAALLPMTAACGKSSPAGPTDPAPSEPVPPVTAAVAGTYALAIVPDPACGLPTGPQGIVMDVVATASAGHTGIRGTLPGGDSTLSLELVYDAPGHLHGSVGTATEITYASGLYVYVRGIADGTVSLATNGRGEITDGPLVGEVEISNDDVVFGDCTSTRHRWSLRAR